MGKQMVGTIFFAPVEGAARSQAMWRVDERRHDLEGKAIFLLRGELEVTRAELDRLLELAGPPVVDPHGRQVAHRR